MKEDEVTVKVVGDEALIRNIKELAIGSPKAIQRGVKHCAGLIERQAKMNLQSWLYSPATPPYPEGHTGRLKASISFNWTGSGMSVSSVGSRAAGTPGLAEPKRRGHILAVIGTNVVYARRHEFGFMDTDSLGRRFNQEARPWLFPAFFSHEGDLYKLISFYIGLELKAAMMRGKAVGK